MSAELVMIRPRDDGSGWAMDIYDGRVWRTTLRSVTGRPMTKAEAHHEGQRQRRFTKRNAERKKVVGGGGGNATKRSGAGSQNAQDQRQSRAEGTP